MNYKTRKVTDYFPRRQERESRRFGKQKSRTTIRLKGQDKTGQDRTGQDRTGQDRTAQDRTARDTRSTDPANTVETRSLRSRSLSSISADPGIAPDRRIERTTRSEHWKANPFRKASGSSYPRRDSGLRSPDAGPDARYNPCRCFCECTTRPRARHDPPDNRYAGNNIPGCNCRPAPRPIGRCQDVRITPFIGVGETLRLPGERNDGDELHSRTLPAQSEDRFGGRQVETAGHPAQKEVEALRPQPIHHSTQDSVGPAVIILMAGKGHGTIFFCFHAQK